MASDLESTIKQQVDGIRKSLDKCYSASIVAKMINDIDYSQLGHECKTVRQLAMISMFMLIRKLFNSISSDRYARDGVKEGEQLATFIGPFVMSNGVLYLVKEELDSAVSQDVSDNIAKWRKLKATNYKLFSYIVKTTTKNTLLQGLDEHRLLEIIENKSLLKSIPDPDSTPVFADLQMFARDLKLIKFINSASTDFRSYTSNHSYTEIIHENKITDLPEPLPVKIARYDKSYKALRCVRLAKRTANSLEYHTIRLANSQHFDEEDPTATKKFRIRDTTIKIDISHHFDTKSDFFSPDILIKTNPMPNKMLNDDHKLARYTKVITPTSAMLQSSADMKSVSPRRAYFKTPISTNCDTLDDLKTSTRYKHSTSLLERIVTSKTANTVVEINDRPEITPLENRAHSRNLKVKNSLTLKKIFNPLEINSANSRPFLADNFCVGSPIGSPMRKKKG